MTTAHDIDTTQALPAITINDDRELCDIVYTIANKQLIINAAEANQQAKIEAAKKAFADGTAEFTAEIKALFAAVQRYAEAHKDRLFPVKGATRKKTFAILQHKLQYRSSDRVEAPADAVARLRMMITASEVNIMNLGAGPAADEIAAVIQQLEGLIRSPEPELNKDAVKAISDTAIKDYLASCGMRVVTDETFKLSFAFTPEQATN